MCFLSSLSSFCVRLPLVECTSQTLSAYSHNPIQRVVECAEEEWGWKGERASDDDDGCVCWGCVLHETIEFKPETRARTNRGEKILQKTNIFGFNRTTNIQLLWGAREYRIFICWGWRYDDAESRVWVGSAQVKIQFQFQFSLSVHTLLASHTLFFTISIWIRCFNFVDLTIEWSVREGKRKPEKLDTLKRKIIGLSAERQLSWHHRLMMLNYCRGLMARHGERGWTNGQRPVRIVKN